MRSRMSRDVCQMRRTEDEIQIYLHQIKNYSREWMRNIDSYVRVRASSFFFRLALFSGSLCMYMAQTAAQMKSHILFFFKFFSFQKLFLCIPFVSCIQSAFVLVIFSLLFACCVCICVLGLRSNVCLCTFFFHFLHFCLLTSWFSARHRMPNTIQFNRWMLEFNLHAAVVELSHLHGNCGIDDDIVVAYACEFTATAYVVNHTKQ